MSKANNNSPGTALKVLLIDEAPIRRTILEARLRETGLTDLARLESATGFDRAKHILVQAKPPCAIRP